MVTGIEETLLYCRLSMLIVSGVCSLLFLFLLVQKMRRRTISVESLLFAIACTDFVFCCGGMWQHILNLQIHYSNFNQDSLAVALDGVFNATFLMCIVWTAMLAYFIITEGNRQYFKIKIAWCITIVLGAIYGSVWATHVANNNDGIYLTIVENYLLTVYIIVVIMIVTALVLVAARRRRDQQRKSKTQRRLLAYILTYSCMQMPYMIVTFTGQKNYSLEVRFAIHMLLYAVPMMNTFMYGLSYCARHSQEAQATTIHSYDFEMPDTIEDITEMGEVVFVASGASGSVYKAQWLGIEVALKMIKIPEVNTTELSLYQTYIKESEESFIHEAKLCARLRHPNITLFIKIGLYNGSLCIITEYCAKGSLKEVLANSLSLSWNKKIAIALDIARGITYLHARNPTYIHRDLKCSNILVTDGWVAKLGDFGISQISNFVQRVKQNGKFMISESNDPHFTSFAGTWRWNAPEILMNPSQCHFDTATDIYSFGMVLWEIATDGATPFDEIQFDYQVRSKVLNEERPQFYLISNPPITFIQLIQECWSHNPADRPSAIHAVGVLEDLSEEFVFYRDPSTNFHPSISFSTERSTSNFLNSNRSTSHFFHSNRSSSSVRNSSLFHFIPLNRLVHSLGRNSNHSNHSSTNVSTTTSTNVNASTNARNSIRGSAPSNHPFPIGYSNAINSTVSNVSKHGNSSIIHTTTHSSSHSHSSSSSYSSSTSGSSTTSKDDGLIPLSQSNYYAFHSVGTTSRLSPLNENLTDSYIEDHSSTAQTVVGHGSQSGGSRASSVLTQLDYVMSYMEDIPMLSPHSYDEQI